VYKVFSTVMEDAKSFGAGKDYTLAIISILLRLSLSVSALDSRPIFYGAINFMTLYSHCHFV
jgi:hypothetical protein